MNSYPYTAFKSSPEELPADLTTLFYATQQNGTYAYLCLQMHFEYCSLTFRRVRNVRYLVGMMGASEVGFMSVVKVQTMIKSNGLY